MSSAISFRFPSDGTFEALQAGPASVSDLRRAILARRPAAQEALHGARALAAAGWKLLLTDVDSKAEYTEDAAVVAAGSQLVATLDYAVRAPKQTRRLFVARFPGGKPGLSAAASGACGWEMQRPEAGTGLLLSGGAAQSSLAGTLEGGCGGNHYLFFLRGEGVVDALPSGPWFSFRPEARARSALTLDEAEARMKARLRAGESAGSWLARGAGPAAVRATPAQQPGAGSDSDSGSARAARRGAASESDSEQGEGEGQGRGSKARKGRGRTQQGGDEGDGGDGDGDGDAQQPESRTAVPRDASPERGEDWEHEGAMTDDDEAAGVGDQMEEGEEQAPPQPPDAMQADGEEQQLNEAGRNVQRLLRAQQRRSEEAEGGEEEDEDDVFEEDEPFEDDDFMDPDKDTRVMQLMADRAQPEKAAPRPPPPAPSSAPPASAPAPPAAAPPRPALKRARSPEAGAMPAVAAQAAAAAAPEEPAAKQPRMLDEETTAQLVALEADCGITLALIREAVTPGGATMKELIKRFKKQLRTFGAQQGFAAVLKKVTRFDASTTKVHLLR